MWGFLLLIITLIAVYSYIEEVVIDGNRTLLMCRVLPVMGSITGILSVMSWVFNWR